VSADDGVAARVPVPAWRCVVPGRALLGEGPVWSAAQSCLYWVDILKPSVHRFDPASGVDVETPLAHPVGLVVPRASGGLLVATSAGLLRWSAEGEAAEPFHSPEGGQPGLRYNDGKCDRLGRLWLGSMDQAAAPRRGSLFVVDAQGCRRMDTGFTVPNGLGWSPDDRFMYFTDSAESTIYVYDFDLARGRIANRRPLLRLDARDGKPDGLSVDAQGCLWVALWDGGQIARFSPEGRRMATLRLPVPRPTSCCFGGPELRTLYVTSASLRLSEQALRDAPLSGAVFAIDLPGVRGQADTPFAG
jgi:sugar lactone lactonase YvrE